MVAKKTQSKKSESPAVVTEAPAPVATPVAPAPVVATESAPASSSATPSTDATDKSQRSFDELMEECIKQAQSQVSANRGLVSTIREASKSHEREMRELLKTTKRNRKQTGGAKKPLTGFAKPCRISDNLADFLRNVAGNTDVVRGMEMSRTEATRRLNEYFVTNNLRDTSDKRTILFEKDPKLVALFGAGITKGTKLTYFNLQSALKSQFTTKTDAPSPVVASAATTAVPASGKK